MIHARANTPTRQAKPGLELTHTSTHTRTDFYTPTQTYRKRQTDRQAEREKERDRERKRILWYRGSAAAKLSHQPRCSPL